MTHEQTRTLVSQLRQRGEALAVQGDTIGKLLEASPVDLSRVLGPALLLSHVYARAQTIVLAWAMQQPEFNSFPLDLQRALGEVSTLWARLRATAGNLASSNRLPGVSVLGGQQPNPIGGVITGSTLESLLSVETLAGIGVSTFWDRKQSGQVSLGRLLSVDLVLQDTVAIDILAEHTEMTDSLVPLTPDFSRLLAKIEAARTLTFPSRFPAPGNAAVTVTPGTTLEGIAQQYLGKPEEWRVLAQINNLRHPYLSEDPQDQLGAQVGNRILESPTAPGALSLVLVEARGLFLDQRLRLDYGQVVQTVTILGVDLETQIVTVAEPLTIAFPTAAIVIVYNPSYDVVGRVLKPGDILFLPTGDTGGSFIQRRATPTESGLYGRDLMLTNGEPQVVNGDLTLVEGRANLSQALFHRFLVERGNLLYHPEYGTGLRDFLGLKSRSFFHFLAEVDARQTVLNDPRVARVSQLTSDVDGTRMNMDITVETTHHEQFAVTLPPLEVR